MIVFLASTPITIHFFFRDIINLVASQTQVEVLIDKSQNPAVFDNLVCELEAGVVDFCIPRKTSAKDVFSLPLFILKTLKRREASTLVSCSPKAALYAALCRFVIGRRIAHIYLIQGSVWYGTVGLKGFIFRQVERFILANSDSKLSVSASERQSRVDLGLAREHSIDLLLRGGIRGVAPDFFNHEAKKIARARVRRELFGETDNDFMVLGYIGRLADDKGIDTILDWCRELLHPDKPMGVLFVGPNEMSPSLRLRFDHVRQEAVKAGIKFSTVDFVSDTFPYFASIDFFLMPSKREGFGISAIEAAAAGAVVIAADIGGLHDALGGGVGGRLIDPDQMSSVPGLINDLAHNTEKREAIVERAQSYVQTNFSSPDVEKRVARYVVEKTN